MKIKMIIASILIVITQIFSQGQGTFELQESDVSAYVVNGVNKQITQNGTVTWWVGRLGTEKHRAFFQWNLPDEVIPDGSEIVSAHLYMTGIRNQGGSTELVAGFFDMQVELESATPQILWDRTDWFNNHFDYYIGGAEAENYIIDVTFTSGSDFTDAIEQSLTNDFFTMGIIDFNEVLHEFWYRFCNCDVKLEITFNRPSVNVIVDQKRSDGITSIDSVGRWEGGPDFVKYAVPQSFTFYVGTQEVLKGKQDLVFNPAEKYNRWNDYSDVQNHKVFDIEDV